MTSKYGDTFIDVAKEYEKNKELKKEDVKLLQEWVATQPHLPHVSELDLILFLHSSYYNIDEAKERLERFYTTKAQWPEVFKNRSPFLHTKFFCAPLPKRTPQGRQIIFIKLIDYDPDGFDFIEELKKADMTLMLMLHQDGTATEHIILWDVFGMTPEHVARISSAALEKGFFYSQEAIPFRFKHYIWIRVPPCMDQFTSSIKQLLNKELLAKMQIFSDEFDELFDFIPKECLPSDYGGELESVEELIKKWNENLWAHESFFIEGEKEIADESKRLVVSTNLTDIYSEKKFDTFADVEEEYRKNAELKKKDIQLLQEWVASQPHLPPVSELDLILFLHSSYYNIGEAKKRIERFYTIKAQWPEVFKNRSPFLNTKLLYAPLPRRTPQGRRIIFVKLTDFDPDGFDDIKEIKKADMNVMLMLHQDGTAPEHIILCDIFGMTPEHAARISSAALEKSFFYFQEVIPFRFKQYVLIRVPPCMDQFIGSIKQVLNKELLAKMQIFSDEFDELFDLIPKECLPSDYGGELESVEELIKKWNENLWAHESFFIEGEKEIADESKRLVVSTNLADIYSENKFDTFADVEEEYRKNAELKKKDIQLLQEWVTSQPHLPPVSEFDLILFLHSSYYKVGEAKERLERFYTIKAQWPEVFKNRSPFLHTKFFCAPLPKRTPQGRQIIFSKLIDFDPDGFDFIKEFKKADMAVQLMLHQNGTAPEHIILCDMSGMTPEHVVRMSSAALKKCFFYFQEAVPFRFKHYIYIKCPPSIGQLFAFIKPLLKKELLDKTHMFSDEFDEVFDLIPKECLPSDYGGRLDSTEELIKKWNENFWAHESFFIEGEKEIADESKRPVVPTNVADIYRKNKFDTFVDVEEEYRKNKELKKEDIQLLQEWVTSQPHLPPVSELDLILFLHSRYYDIETTKKCIETFYTVRAQVPEFFKNRNPSTNTKIYETMFHEPLPQRSTDGYQIIFSKITDSNPDNLFFAEHFKCFDMTVTLMLHQTGTVPGHILLTDLGKLTFEQIAKMNPTTMKKLFTYLQEGLPFRFKHFIIFNAPACADEFFSLMKPYMTEELAEKTKFITGKLDKVYELIPKKCFPSDYGGEADSTDELRKKMREKFLAHEKFFVEGEKEIADETKRLREQQSFGEVFYKKQFDTFIDVQTEYEKNQELKKDDVKLLQEWIATQPHLPQISELDIILFLHSRYYNTEATKKCIETFYTVRGQVPEFFKNRNPSTNTKIYETMFYEPLPQRSTDGYQIIFSKVTDSNLDNFFFAEHFKCFDMAVTLMLHQTGTVPGHILLVDMAKLTFEQIANINPAAMKKLFVYVQYLKGFALLILFGNGEPTVDDEEKSLFWKIQPYISTRSQKIVVQIEKEALPFRFEHFIFFNAPACADALFSLLKPNMTKELAERTQFITGKLDKVYELIPKECFPSDYGGEADSTDELRRKMKENFLAHEKFFVEGEKDIADESKRVGKQQSFGESLYKKEFDSFADIQTEYEKNKELKKDDVKLLQEWIATQPHLPQISDLDVILFLHSCYYNVEEAKKRIETSYTFKAHSPEIFKNRNPSTNAKIFDKLLFTSLPKPTPQGYQIFYVKFIDFNSDNFIFSEQIKSFEMSFTLMLQQTGTAPGHIILIDTDGFTTGHIRKTSPISLKKYFDIVQKILPIRLKKFILFNIPSSIYDLLALCKPYFEEEFMEKLHVFTNSTDDLKELYKIVPKECLPVDYGGEVDSIYDLTKKRKENFLAHEIFFVETEKEIADDSKRVDEPWKITHNLSEEYTSASGQKKYDTFVDVAKQYEKNKELKKKDVQLLQAWVASQPHLPPISELDVILFLHSCYYNIEEAKTRIETYYTFKAQSPEIFKNRNPSTNNKILDTLLFTPLPKATPQGYQIHYCKFIDTNSDNFIFSEQIKSFEMSLTLMLKQTGTVPGHIVLADMDSFKAGHISKMSAILIKKCFDVAQKILPLRLKNFIFFNISPSVNDLVALAKPYFEEEFMRKFHTFTNSSEDLNELYNIVPRECFPVDYGGEVDSINDLTKKRNENLLAHETFFVENEKEIADDSKRVDKPWKIANNLSEEYTSASGQKKYDTFIDVAKEYEKNRELKKKDVQLLQEWVASQPHLPPISELDVILFLHSCYYNIEEAKRRIETYYTFKAQSPEIFKNRNPSTNTKILDTLLFTPLPKATPQGYQIHYCKFIDTNSDNFIFSEQIKSFEMSLTLMLKQTGTVPGHIVLADMDSFKAGHLSKMSAILIKKCFDVVQKILPLRLKKFIFFNISPSVNDLVVLSKPFFEEEFMRKFHTFTNSSDDLNELYKIVPKECLPVDYGGEVDSIDDLTKKRNENLLAHETFFVETEKEIADDSKRVDKPWKITHNLGQKKYDTFIDVAKEYEKNKQLKEEDVQLLQGWIASQPHLPSISELDVILFLHSCHYNIEEAKERIETCYTFKAQTPEIFKDRNPSTNTRLLKTILFTPLPKATPQGYQIIYCRFLDFNSDNYIPFEQIKHFDMSVSLMLKQTGTTSGHIVLIDLEGFTSQHLRKLNVFTLKKYFDNLQRILPVCLKKFIVINAPSCMNDLLALCRPSFEVDFDSKLHIFTNSSDDLNELYKIIPRECFPVDYGGEVDSIEELTKKRNENFLAHEMFFVESEREVADETKRVDKPWNVTHILDDEYRSIPDVAKEYEKNKELKKKDVQLLQGWVASQPHLPQISEFRLILFLHRCYYDIEKTKKHIESYYAAKAQWPEAFKNRSTLIHSKSAEMVLYMPLPKLTPQGYQIFFSKFIDPDLDRFCVMEQIKCLFMSLTLMLHQKGTAPGHIIICDISDLTLGHILRMSPNEMTFFFFYIREIVPLRWINIIYINAPSCMDQLLTLIKPLVGKEFLDLIRIYSDNLEELYTLIPKECLPSNYGGEVDSVEELSKKMKANLLAYESFLVEDEKDIADESKRVSKLEDWEEHSAHEDTLVYAKTALDTFVDVKKEYKTNKQLKKRDVQLLQDWVSKQPHLPPVSELYLILFLHRSYYNVEATKKCIETFYTLRAGWPELFKNRRASVNTKILETALYTPLSKPTPQGYQIIFCKFMDFNSEHFSLEEQMKALDMAIILALHQTGTAPGYVIICDLSGFTLELIMKLRLPVVKRFFYYMQEALPIRLVSLIFINVPSYMSGFWTLLKTFFQSEILEKIQLYTEQFDEVYQLVPRECFPSDYGGETASIEELIRTRRRNFLVYESFFAEDEKAIADETKRVDAPPTTEDVLEDDELVGSAYGM